MDTQPTISKIIKRNFLFISVLVLTMTGVLMGVRYWLSAQSGEKIPPGFTALSYINALESADKNNDGYINGLDGAFTVKRYGKERMMKDPKFGDSFNSLERSFQIEHWNENIRITKAKLLADKAIAERYAQDIIVANEQTIETPKFVTDDKVFNEKNPIGDPNIQAFNNTDVSTQVLGASDQSPDTKSGGTATGSTGADSGKTVIPQILGTVSPYTGSAGFDYPLSLPAGPGGVAPALSITYSSGNVDDVVPYNDGYKYCIKFDYEKLECSNHETDYFYRNKKSYHPFYAGYGFSINGGGSIVRDTRQEKEVYVLGGDIHHKFILNLPSGLSAEIKYNKVSKRWVSIPEGFVKIDHLPPAPAGNGSTIDRIDGQPMPGSDFKIVDGTPWVVTASDGSKYYFGEVDLSKKIDVNGKIIGEAIREVEKGKLHHITTTQGGIFNEFDISDLCSGIDTSEPCKKGKHKNGQDYPGYLDEKKSVLLTTKWLLRRMETSDGKAIDYVYDNYQKYYGKKDGPEGDFYKKTWDNKLEYAVVDSYLREVRWNDDNDGDYKHRVVLFREPRPDTGDDQFASKYRLSKIDVETKLEASKKFDLVRRYQLSYTNDNSAMVADGGTNEWNSSLLSSITEFGKDGKTTVPPASFKYKQYSFNTGSSGSLIYLDTINNGYGGETQYIYEPFSFASTNGSGDTMTGQNKLRVIEKKVVDKTSNPVRSFRETYDYNKDPKTGRGTEVGFADRIRGKHVSGREFLGHGEVDVRTYDFNSDKLLSHTKTQFYQFNHSDGNKIIHYNCVNGKCKTKEEFGYICFEPHLNKGQPKFSITYNILPDGTEFEAQRSTTNYNYRLLGWDDNNKGTITQDNINVESKKCEGIGMTQPYFVFAKDSTTTVTEKESSEFAKAGVLENLRVNPVNTRTVKSENIQYDLFGNLLKAVSYGQVDATGKDVDPKDNRFSFSQYLTPNINWLNNLPYVTYSSNKSDCNASQEDAYCQYGKSITWYDQFYGDYSKVDPNTQEPKYGLVTQIQNTIDTDENHDGNHDDPILSYAGTEYLRLSDDPKDKDKDPNNDTSDARRGGPIKVYGPRPNVKNITNTKDQMALLSQSEYDPYYNTLVISTKNALGHQSFLEDYDYLLQIPRRSRTQISENPDKFAVNRVEYDALGRSIASFPSDPADPSKTVDFPSVVNAYFDLPAGRQANGADTGLATRQMSLVSQTSNGKLHYSASDSFYDGLGQVKQVQVLSKKVLGAPRRLVADTLANAAGNQIETFEQQEADPVILPDIDGKNYKEAIRSQVPQFVSIPHKVLSKSVFDGLNRPIESTTFDTDNNFSMTSKTFYYVNAQKSVNPKGVISFATTDELGRPYEGLTIDPVGDQHTMTINEYGQEMIDKPTSTTYKSIKQLEGGNSAVATVKYDKSGRVLSADEPSLGKSEFIYDVLGNVVESKRAHLENIGTEYDILGRQVKTKYYHGDSEDLFKDTPIESSDIVYTYDKGQNALGKVVSVDYHTGRDEIVYDQAGRVKTTKKTIKDKTYSTTNHYNLLSQVVSTDYPENREYKVEYDDEGVVQKSYLNGKELASSTIFDKFGNTQESQFILGANTYLLRTPHDSMGRLKQLGFAKKVTATPDGQGALQSYFYQEMKYDQFSQLTPLVETTFPDGVEKRTDYNYTYDQFSRLTKAESSKYTATYTYDPFGRIQTKNEKEPITLAYNSEFPFFAPKSMVRPKIKPEVGGVIPTLTPIASPTTEPSPTLILKPSATLTPTRKLTPKPTIPIDNGQPSPTQSLAVCTFYPKVRINFEKPEDKPSTFTPGEWGIINEKSLTQSGKSWENLNADDLQDFSMSGNDGVIDHGPATIPNNATPRKCCTNKLTENPNDPIAIENAYSVAGSKSELTNSNKAIVYFKFPENYEVVNRTCGLDEDGDPVDCKTETGGQNSIPLPHDGIGNLPIYCGGNYEYTWTLQKKSTGLQSLFRGKKANAQAIDILPEGFARYFFAYDDVNKKKKGTMLEDDKQCYSYNRLNQLISMKIKKNKGNKCAGNEFTKSIYFYYDYAGTLVLQEEYKGNTTTNPSKKTYYFGSYEDIYESAE